MFKLHPQLAQDTVSVATSGLCQVLLMNDARFPWLILVPQRSGLRELHDLPAGERTQLMEEITVTSQALESCHAPDKINVGALGNLVEQLHIHVIARNRNDDAWPGPVWGQGTPVPYAQNNLDRIRNDLITALEAAEVK
jgi:diadenosine tetraphosphate (Ap4A) HIT family hydrolase